MRFLDLCNLGYKEISAMKNCRIVGMQNYIMRWNYLFCEYCLKLLTWLACTTNGKCKQPTGCAVVYIRCREHSDALGCPKYVNKAKKGDQVVMSHKGSNAPQENESLHVFMKLPLYPSSKPTLTLTSHLGKNVGLREG